MFIEPSESVSLAVIFKIAGTSSFVVAASLLATGIQFGTGFTVSTVAVETQVISAVLLTVTL